MQLRRSETAPGFAGIGGVHPVGLGIELSVETAAGIDSAAGGEPPASTNATVVEESSDNREAMTAPAGPPPTTTK